MGIMFINIDNAFEKLLFYTAVVVILYVCFTKMQKYYFRFMKLPDSWSGGPLLIKPNLLIRVTFLIISIRNRC